MQILTHFPLVLLPQEVFWELIWELIWELFPNMSLVGEGFLQNFHRVGDADMVDAHHTPFEHSPNLVHVLKGEGAIVELVEGHFVVDNAVDHFVDALLVVGLEALAGGLNGIDEHDDGRFAGKGGGT